MTTPAKFIIKNEFLHTSGSELRKLEQEIADLKDNIPVAERRGYRAAQEEADGLLAAAIQRLSHDMIRSLDAERALMERGAIDLAVQIARTLAGKLLDGEPSTAIAAMAASCIESLRKCPHIVFHVHPDSVATVEQHLKKLSYERGIEGRLIVLGDPDKALGDCKIEWADGGFERNQNDISAKIEDAVTRYLDKKHSIVTPQHGEGDLS